MPSCFVMECRVSKKEAKNVHLMRIRQNATAAIRKQWKKNIPKYDSKKFDFLKSTLCHKHFEERYVESVTKVTMLDKIIAQEPRKRWRLTEDAVPTIFPGSVSSNTSNHHKPKKAKKKSLNGNSISSRLHPNATSAGVGKGSNVADLPFGVPRDPLELDETETATVNALDIVSAFKKLNIRLPPNWFLTYEEKHLRVRLFNLVPVPGSGVPTFVSERTIQITGDKYRPVPVLFLRHRKIENQFKQHFFQLLTEDYINKLILQVNDLKLCSGIKTESIKVPSNKVCVPVNAIRCGDSWFSIDCWQIHSGTCGKCRKLKIKFEPVGLSNCHCGGKNDGVIKEENEADADRTKIVTTSTKNPVSVVENDDKIVKQEPEIKSEYDSESGPVD